MLKRALFVLLVLLLALALFGCAVLPGSTQNNAAGETAVAQTPPAAEGTSPPAASTLPEPTPAAEASTSAPARTADPAAQPIVDALGADLPGVHCMLPGYPMDVAPPFEPDKIDSCAYCVDTAAPWCSYYLDYTTAAAYDEVADFYRAQMSEIIDDAQEYGTLWGYVGEYNLFIRITENASGARKVSVKVTPPQEQRSESNPYVRLDTADVVSLPEGSTRSWQYYYRILVSPKDNGYADKHTNGYLAKGVQVEDVRAFYEKTYGGRPDYVLSGDAQCYNLVWTEGELRAVVSLVTSPDGNGTSVIVTLTGAI
ncbi:MAG TPA: hypothetical protein VN540_01015 [Clostridia bacterium]|nr:hypothetical protein [Clostridia bacterium]